MRYTKHGLSGVCGVYVITNIANGKQYVGSSNNVGARINQHFGGACRKYKDNLDFYHDIFVLGREGFSYQLLEKCTPDMKIEREYFWWESLRPEYNLTAPRVDPFRDPIVRKRSIEGTLRPDNQARLNAIKQTPEYRGRLREAQSYKMRPCYGVSEDGNTPYFLCITDAAKWLAEQQNRKPVTVVSKIKAVLDGERPTAYGYRWYEGGGCNG